MPACHVQYGQPPSKQLNTPRDLDEFKSSAPLNGRRTTSRHQVTGSASKTPLLSVYTSSSSINYSETSGDADRSSSGSSEAPTTPRRRLSAADSAKEEKRVLSRNDFDECEECSSNEGETSHLLGYLPSHRESEQRPIENLPVMTEDDKSEQAQPLPKAQDQMGQDEAESEREFQRLPYDMQCYLHVLAAETGKWPANGIRERTLCGSEMWVERESGEVAWKSIDWDPPPREVMEQFTQEDSMLSLDHRPSVARAIEDGPANTNLDTHPDRPPERRPEIDSWSPMESLAPVHSRSAPTHLRMRAGRKRKPATGTGGVTRAIRNWFAGAKRTTSAGNEQTNESRRFSMKEILKRPWKKRESHDSGIYLEGNGKRDHEWDSVGPRNEDLYSTGTSLKFSLVRISKSTCFGCHPV